MQKTSIVCVILTESHMLMIPLGFPVFRVTAITRWEQLRGKGVLHIVTDSYSRATVLRYGSEPWQ